MADTPTTAVASYGEGVKWLVGLSAAAVAGAFLHFQQLAAQPIFVRLSVALAIALFTVSIWAGVWYLLWLNTIAIRKESKKEITEELGTAVSQDRKNTLGNRYKEAERKIEVGEATMPTWHFIYTWCFAAAMLISGLVLVASLFLHSKPSPHPVNASPIQAHTEPPNHFVVTFSAIHKTSHGKEAHTFLLDQSTGDLWQMVCGPNNQVLFRHVERLPDAPTKK